MNSQQHYKTNSHPPLPIGVTAAEIADKLGAKPAGPGKWMALCPAHDDKNPSLSITDDNGKLLLHCFSGCEFKKILRAATNGVEHRPETTEVFDIDEIRRQAALRWPGDSQGHRAQKVVARYGYTDEQGKLLYQVVRFDPKDFRQRRPSGKRGWVWNLKGVEPVLYRLPEVHKATLVYVVEGEKDVATLRKLGLTATTNSGGAGKWRPEFSAVLKGKRVVVIPDNDEPGRRHTETVARSVHDAGAEWVKVVTLPTGKDVTEWVQAGGTKEQLIEIVKTAVPYEPPVSDDIESIADVRSIFSFAGTNVEFDVEDIILANSVTVVAGESGSGKSTLVTAMCDKISRGEDFAGLATRKRPVLYLDRENPLFAVVERFERLGIRDSADFKIWGGWEREEPPAPLSSKVVEWVKKCNPGPLIVVDSLKAFHGGDENNATEMHSMMAQFRDLAHLGATVIVLHNRSEKSEANYRGSTVIKQDADVGFSLTNSGIDGKLGSLKMTPFKQRVMVSGIAFTYSDAGFAEDQNVPRPVRDGKKLHDILVANPGITKENFQKLAQKRGIGRNAARRFLDQGFSDATIDRTRSGKNTHHYTANAGDDLDEPRW